MKIIDKYHKWIEWSDEDKTYIGRCPDLITGIHGSDPVKLYEELIEVLEEVIGDYKKQKRTLPKPSVKPMQEVL
jgi:predicted RNase H-like HicB family nuclease